MWSMCCRRGKALVAGLVLAAGLGAGPVAGPIILAGGAVVGAGWLTWPERGQLRRGSGFAPVSEPRPSVARAFDGGMSRWQHKPARLSLR
jgi:hypothetical protein